MKKYRTRKKKAIIVSACLLGVNCKYNGGNNLIKGLKETLQKFDIISICPEQYGNLKTPRKKAEILNDMVFDTRGRNLTKHFIKGAIKSLRKAKRFKVAFAILKSKSPSCGIGLIYDGSFSEKLVNGNGFTAHLLMNNGIKVISSDVKNSVIKVF